MIKDEYLIAFISAIPIKLRFQIPQLNWLHDHCQIKAIANNAAITQMKNTTFVTNIILFVPRTGYILASSELLNAETHN